MSSRLAIMNEILMIDNRINIILEEMSAYERKRRRLRRRNMAALLSVFISLLSIFLVPERRIWREVRSSSWWDSMVINIWDSRRFKENFRVNRQTFDFLCKVLKPHLEKKKFIREPVSVEKQVAVTLAKLGSSCELRYISNLFGIGRSTVCIIVNKTTRVICNLLKIKFPKKEEIPSIALKFVENGGLPGCVGSLGVCHIPIKAPKINPDEYFNKKSFHSIILQGLVDTESKFMDIFVGWPGSVSDTTVFQNSPLYQLGESGTLLPAELTMESGSFQTFVVANAAYPLLPWLMKPFSGPLSTKQDSFNKKLIQSRDKVEHAFAMLKCRFQCLLKQNESNLENIVNQVEACCILHNLCCKRQDIFLAEWYIEDLELDADNIEVDESVCEESEINNSSAQLRNKLLAFC